MEVDSSDDEPQSSDRRQFVCECKGEHRLVEITTFCAPQQALEPPASPAHPRLPLEKSTIVLPPGYERLRQKIKEKIDQHPKKCYSCKRICSEWHIVPRFSTSNPKGHAVPSHCALHFKCPSCPLTSLLHAPLELSFAQLGESAAVVMQYVLLANDRVNLLPLASDRTASGPLKNPSTHGIYECSCKMPRLAVIPFVDVDWLRPTPEAVPSQQPVPLKPPVKAKREPKTPIRTEQELMNLPDPYLPGAISLLEQLDKHLVVVLRDGRKLIGYLRSIDQFANLVLDEVVERTYIGKYYSEIRHGILLIRGENVVLAGELDDSISTGLIKVSVDEMRRIEEQAEKAVEEQNHYAAAKRETLDDHF